MRGPLRIVIALAGLAPALLATPAQAGTASLEQGPGRASLVYRADPGQTNRVRVVLEGGNAAPSAIAVTDFAGIVPGTGCAAAGTADTVRCPLPPGSAPGGYRITLGDGNDTARLAPAPRVGAEIRGGSGDDFVQGGSLLFGDAGADSLEADGARSDRVVGGSGPDNLRGGRGPSRLEPGPGNDVAWGGFGNGNDTFLARDGAGDELMCSGGRDRLVMDLLDIFRRRCSQARLRRPGAGRAVPRDAFLSTEGFFSLQVACPLDGPRTCVGWVTASVAGRAFGRFNFAVRRGDARSRLIATGPSTERLLRRGRAFRMTAFTRRGSRLLAARARGPLTIERTAERAAPGP